MFCTKCGAPVEAGGAYCSACGAKVVTDVKVQSEYSQLAHRLNYTYDEEHAEKIEIAKSAMIWGIVSCCVPAFLAWIFALISKSKLNDLNEYRLPGGNTFLIIARITSTVGFIYGIATTIAMSIWITIYILIFASLGLML